MSHTKYVSDKIRQNVMEKQNGKCANTPTSNLNFIGDFECPCWQTEGSKKGKFIKGKFELDHIMESSVGGTNEEHNVQYLCLYCHDEKTRNFMSYRAERNKISHEAEHLKYKYEKLNREAEQLKHKCEQLNRKYNYVGYENSQKDNCMNNIEQLIDPIFMHKPKQSDNDNDAKSTIKSINKLSIQGSTTNKLRILNSI